jgi:hypothetical protein
LSCNREIGSSVHRVIGRNNSRLLSHSRAEHRSTTRSANWRVIHACEYARDILPVIEGQVAAGIRPYIVTPQGSGTAELYLAKRDLGERAALSLLRAWQDVRNWRKSLLECDPENSSDLVHTHSFASGMAGVRNLSCVVYDLNACIEEFALSAGLCERGSWMGRSFRVAEQFILSRAQAVVVHSLGMKAAVEERGAPLDSVFLIPEPLAATDNELPGLETDLGEKNFWEKSFWEKDFRENGFLQKRFGFGPVNVSYFVPQEAHSQKAEVPQATVAALQAFALVVPEVPEAQLLIESASAALPAIHNHAESLGIAERVIAVEQNESLEVMRNATIVLATGELPDDPVRARHPNDVCLRSLTMGKALLAADTPRNRDGSPEGRGCLWFKEGDVRDLAYRMAFLGHNSDFRTTLAASGRAHILQTRDSTAVGQQYDAAYRHALSRKKTGGPGQQARVPAQQYVISHS